MQCNKFARKIISYVVSIFILILIATFIYASPILPIVTQNIEEKGDGLIASNYASDWTKKQNDATVIELFTSQSCSSCPRAEALLRNLSQESNTLTFEFHVDYWNDFSDIFAGTWKDPFSSNEATLRQEKYNITLRDSERMYTPQAIIDGSFETSGANRPKIEKAIVNAIEKRKQSGNVAIIPLISSNGELNITLNKISPSKDAKLLLLRFFKRRETIVKSGENKGKKLASYNIVSHWSFLKKWNSKVLTFKTHIPALLQEESCAVIMQDTKTLEIYGAGLCQKQELI